MLDDCTACAQSDLLNACLLHLLRDGAEDAREPGEDSEKHEDEDERRNTVFNLGFNQ